MGRIPCCEKDNVKRGQWTPEEDNKLSSYVAKHGTRNWRLVPKNAGLQRCGKSCRLRWTNYLRPDLKHGEFSKEEEQTIIKLHSIIGNRWSIIATRLSGRTDNDVKNHWNTKLKKQLTGMGIDPVTHKPISHLISEITATLEPPQVAHLTEAALGCFKDEMLHLLTMKRINFQLQQPNAVLGNGTSTYINCKQEEKDDSIEKVNFGWTRAMQEPDMLPSNKFWDSNGTSSFANVSGNCSDFSLNMSGFQYGTSSFSNEGVGSPWNQSMCTESTCTTGDQRCGMQDNVEENGENCEIGKERRNEPMMFNSDSVIWDLPSDDLLNPLL